MRPKLLITGAAVATLGGAVAGLALAWGSAAKEPAANPALPPATAKVTRTTLVDTKTVSGTLGYGEAVPVRVAAGRGTLTWIAPEGATVKRGAPLFKVDQRPVVALYGSLPLYRTLRAGVQGTDVKQFEENLSRLGYTGFTVDDTYTGATAKAARSWQADLGLPETGAVEPGQVVVTPGTVRVAERTARVGDLIGDDASVLSYTRTTRLVTVQLEVADQALAKKERAVTVTVPGGASVDGKIAKVGTVATAPETASGTPGGSDQAAAGAPGGSSPTAADARIQVTVTIADQNKLGSLDAAPVDVDFVSQARKDVLAVPVAALLALPNGGYGVQIAQGGAARIVAVKTGMFAAARVEISGDGIAEGVTVGMPK